MHDGKPIDHDGQPIDTATHIHCVRLAWTLVSRISGLLRPEEVNQCAQQFYLDIREHEHMQRQSNPEKEGR